MVVKFSPIEKDDRCSVEVGHKYGEAGYSFGVNLSFVDYFV
jgi:hypothetical protein